jgi:hypothetical protein
MLIQKKDSSMAEKNFSIGAQIQVSIVPQVKVKGMPHTTARKIGGLKRRSGVCRKNASCLPLTKKLEINGSAFRRSYSEGKFDKT